MKRCRGCDESKPPQEYWRAKAAKDGLQTFCKSCSLILSAARQWDNRDQLRAERKARYARDRVKERAQYKVWCANNPEKHRGAVDSWNARNPKRRVEMVRRWQTNNPERARVISRRATTNRRARKLNAFGFVERIDPQHVFERDGGVCQICQKPVDPNKFHVDHIKPLAKGGEHSLANVQLTHPKCNLRKGTKYGIAA